MLEQKKINYKQVAASLLLSLLCHVLALAAILWYDTQHESMTSLQGEPRARSRTIQLKINKEASPAQPTPPEPPPFIKTASDQLVEPPEEHDFIGARDTRESSEKQPTSDEKAPEHEGDKEKKELATFEQEKQDGDLAHDTPKSADAPEQAPTPQPVALPPSGEESTPLPPSPSPIEPSEQSEEQAETTETERPIELDVRPEVNILTDELTLQDYIENPLGDLAQDLDDELPQPEDFFPPKPSPPPPPPRLAKPHGFKTLLQPVTRNERVYDPAYTPSAQPGFRTTERKTQSTGRFVFGDRSSFNAAATPLGRYHELIYRRIAYYWYQACDEHAGDIVTGTLIIRLIINGNGSVRSMELMKRRGASISQQSFTFTAIRKASIPPIPSNVRKELVANMMELVFEFHFN